MQISKYSRYKINKSIIYWFQYGDCYIFMNENFFLRYYKNNVEKNN